MRVFVINMDKDTDRLKQVKKSAAINNINFERISGVSINNEYIKKSPEISHLMKLFGTKGMIGCFLAHKKVWSKMVFDNIPCAVICEDDITFSSNFNTEIQKIEKDITILKFDMLILSCLVGAKPPDKYNMLEKIYKTFFKIEKYRKINDKYFIPEFFGGTQCYILTLQSAKKLLKYLEKVSYHVDTVISNSSHIKKIALYNAIITNNTEEGLSNNVTNTFLLDNFFKKKTFCTLNLSWLLNFPFVQIPIFTRNIGINITIRFIIKFIILLFLIIFLYKRNKIMFILALLLLFFL
jgi:glycosyl transferase family 25